MSGLKLSLADGEPTLPMSPLNGLGHFAEHRRCQPRIEGGHLGWRGASGISGGSPRFT
jgi:hypothetical protein